MDRQEIKFATIDLQYLLLHPLSRLRNHTKEYVGRRKSQPSSISHGMPLFFIFRGALFLGVSLLLGILTTSRNPIFGTLSPSYPYGRHRVPTYTSQHCYRKIGATTHSIGIGQYVLPSISIGQHTLPLHRHWVNKCIGILILGNRISASIDTGSYSDNGQLISPQYWNRIAYNTLKMKWWYC